MTGYIINCVHVQSILGESWSSEKMRNETKSQLVLLLSIKGFPSCFLLKTLILPPSLSLQERSLICVTCVVLLAEQDTPWPNTGANTQVSNDTRIPNLSKHTHRLYVWTIINSGADWCFEQPHFLYPHSFSNCLLSLFFNTHAYIPAHTTHTQRHISVTCCCQW